MKRTFGTKVFVLAALMSGRALAEDKSATAEPKAKAETKTEDKATAEPKAKADAKPDAKPDEKAKPADEKPKPGAPARSLGDLLEEAGRSGAEKAKDVAPGPIKPEPKKTVAAVKLPPKPTAPVLVDAPPPTGTDDNDNSAEAAKPTALKPVVPTTAPRRRGAYDLGPLDCRMLDGAGIERVLAQRIVAGEEPDLLCRIIVTQPADVLSEEHSLTFSVLVGEKESFRQTRKVRMSNVGRRALVFLVPADKIASDDATMVKVSALLTAPATPAGGRGVKFKVEPLD